MVQTIDETVEDTKSKAVDLLSSLLNNVGNVDIEWSFHNTLGFNSVVNNVELELADPRYGKVTDFDYEPIGVKDDYTIIVYYQPGCNIYGYGVLSEEGDICLEITVFDLVEWIVPTGAPDYEVPDRINQLHGLITKMKHLPNN